MEKLARIRPVLAILTIVALCFTLLLLGCAQISSTAGSGPGSGFVGSVLFKVTNSINGENIPGAIITFNGFSCVTSSSGEVSLSSLPIGDHGYTVTKEGFAIYASMVKILADVSLTINIALTPEANAFIPSGLSAVAKTGPAILLNWDAITDTDLAGIQCLSKPE